MRLRAACQSEGSGPDLGGCGATPHQLWLSCPPPRSISLRNAAPLLGARRRPQFVRDWKAVWEQYQRYQTLRMELSDGRGVELNGGEAAKAAFV